MSVIYERRSIRQYKKTAVDKTLLTEVVRAGMYAPSAGDAEPWHFIIIDDKEVIKKIQNLKYDTPILEDVPAVIIVLGDRIKEKMPDSSYADLGACTENILLRAKELGLETCWLSVFPINELMNNFHRLFKLPQHIYPYCAVAIGYSDEHQTSKERYIQEKIHYNEW